VGGLHSGQGIGEKEMNFALKSGAFRRSRLYENGIHAHLWFAYRTNLEESTT
jgi:hypothetical protein